MREKKCGETKHRTTTVTSEQNQFPSNVSGHKPSGTRGLVKSKASRTEREKRKKETRSMRVRDRFLVEKRERKDKIECCTSSFSQKKNLRTLADLKLQTQLQHQPQGLQIFLFFCSFALLSSSFPLSSLGVSGLLTETASNANRRRDPSEK